jgi:hypothetical protein
VTSLYPNDGLVPGTGDTRQFINMYWERELRRDLIEVLNATFVFNTRHVFMTLIVQSNSAFLGEPSLIFLNIGAAKQTLHTHLVPVTRPEEALLEPFRDFVSAPTHR